MGVWDKFGWPLPAFAGLDPVISNPFKKPKHRGVDLMYPREKPGKPDLPWQTKNYEFFPGIPVVSCGPGNVYSIGKSKKGANIIIVDHHNVPGFGPLASMYAHVERIQVKARDVVDRDTILAYGGHTGTDTAHLHFALSVDAADKWGFDPAPLLAKWPYAFSTATPPATVPAEKGNVGWLILLLIAILSSKR